MGKQTKDDEVKVSDPGDLRILLRNALRMESSTDLNRFDRHFEPIWFADLHRGIELAFPRVHGFTVEMRGLGGVTIDRGDGRMVPLVPPGLDALLSRSSRGGFGWTGNVRLPTSPGRTGNFPQEAVYIVSQGKLRALFLVAVADSGWARLEGASRGDHETVEWTEGLVKQLESWMSRHSCYRRHTLRPLGTSRGLALDFMLVAEDEEISMPPELVTELEESFLHFQTHRETLEELGLECRRGLLLHGEPGTGKTVTCRYLKSRLPEHTFFVVDSQAFGLLDAVFAVARRIKPSIVVIEDVDMIAQERSAGSQNWLVGDLLNLLDGIQDRDDVGIILTSNSCAFLEKALVDRPGRVDHIVRYRPPTDEHRLHLLRTFTREMTLEAPDARLLQLTAGLTPAQLKELVKRATVISLQRAGPCAWTRVITGEDLQRAAGSMTASHGGRRPRRIGLGRMSETPEARGA